MFRPHVPINPLPTGIVSLPTPSASDVETRHESAPTVRTTVQITPGSALALAAGGGAVVLVVGTVLVSLLLALAITGVSVAVIAVVLRLLVKDLQKGR
ncbi:SpdD-like protein [Streptomyces sp. NPDC101118]|uniref:SpdD-like protein n=1 Tax=Streptomyces sp. NPDC101118 TaxID=3366109 RepID=UPI003821CD70